MAKIGSRAVVQIYSRATAAIRASSPKSGQSGIGPEGVGRKTVPSVPTPADAHFRTGVDCGLSASGRSGWKAAIRRTAVP